MFLVYFIQRLERVTGMLQSCAQKMHIRVLIHISTAVELMYIKKDFKL